MVLALKDQWIRDSWYVHDGKRRHFLKAGKSIGDPELRHMNHETGAIAYG
ncbi:hypothetical protein [Mesorhizobium sp.]|nr:hypothetical protein [Mesorhizobium sp.]